MEVEKFQYHFEPKSGWMNDPNGLCFFQGKVHAFYQHYPHAPKWGPMHWGHAVTEDFIHWEHLPIALYPDRPYDDFLGCFSGSALEKDGVLYLMYTAVSKEHGQTQAMARSVDGVHFEKLPENPVIPVSPLDPANKDFRDPKMFKFGDGYRMVCGAGVDGLASVLLFKSDDLLHWTYMGPIFESRDYGPVPECPDLFPLGDKWVLMFSRMDETRSAQFVVGDFDGEHFTPESFQQPELGPDFYAPQTFLDGKGRRVLIGWMYNWTRTVPENALRAGAFTIPREVTLKDGKVCTYPVEEARHLLVTENDRKVLADGTAREVFINGGEQSRTFYVTEKSV